MIGSKQEKKILKKKNKQKTSASEWLPLLETSSESEESDNNI